MNEPDKSDDREQDALRDSLAYSAYRKRRSPQPGLGRLQDLIGAAKNVYPNDRLSDRADKLIPMLDEAFEIVLRLRSKR